MVSRVTRCCQIARVRKVMPRTKCIPLKQRTIRPSPSKPTFCTSGWFQNSKKIYSMISMNEKLLCVNYWQTKSIHSITKSFHHCSVALVCCCGSCAEVLFCGFYGLTFFYLFSIVGWVLAQCWQIYITI